MFIQAFFDFVKYQKNVDEKYSIITQFMYKIEVFNVSINCLIIVPFNFDPKNPLL